MKAYLISFLTGKVQFNHTGFVHIITLLVFVSPDSEGVGDIPGDSEQDDCDDVGKLQRRVAEHEGVRVSVEKAWK